MILNVQKQCGEENHGLREECGVFGIYDFDGGYGRPPQGGEP